MLKNGNSPEPVSNSTWSSLDIGIVGAGIGGLAAAIPLARQNHTVTVYEQSHELSEVGINLQSTCHSSARGRQCLISIIG